MSSGVSWSSRKVIVGRRHLPSDEEINLAPMILIVRQTLVDLRFGEVGEAGHEDAVHCFAVLEQTNDVMDADARAFDDGITAASARPSRDVSVPCIGL